MTAARLATFILNWSYLCACLVPLAAVGAAIEQAGVSEGWLGTFMVSVGLRCNWLVTVWASVGLPALAIFFIETSQRHNSSTP